MVELLDRLDGSHLFMTFALFAVAGFAVVVVDQYAFSKLEMALQVTPAAF
jgi:hypothetical protein